MKLTILGTGCPWTKRACANYLLDNNIIVDPGAGSVKQLLKSNDKLLHHEKIERIDLILITHFHLDHYGDIPYLLQKCATGKYGPNNKLTIIAPPNARQIIEQFTRLSIGDHSANKIGFDEHIDWYEAGDFTTFKWRDLEITSLVLDHGHMIDYGYMIKQPNGKVISFTGDTVMTPNVEYMIEHSDLCVCCMSNTMKEKAHYNIIEGIELMKKYRGKCCLIPAHMTSQAIDYARTRIKMPYDLMVVDTDDELPYDYELPQELQEKREEENDVCYDDFEFATDKFHIIRGKHVNLNLTDTFIPKEKWDNSPIYLFSIYDKKQNNIGWLKFRVGRNEFVKYNGNVEFDFHPGYLNMAPDAFEILTEIANYHGMDQIYFCAKSNDMVIRHVYEEIGCKLLGIKYIVDDHDKELVSNGDTEHCIYTLDTCEESK